MKHDVKAILIKAFTGKHRDWAIVLTTLLALLITTGIVSSVQVRITAEQPSTYAQSPNGDKSAGVPNVGSQSGTNQGAGKSGAGTVDQAPGAGTSQPPSAGTGRGDTTGNKGAPEHHATNTPEPTPTPSVKIDAEIGAYGCNSNFWEFIITGIRDRTSAP